MTPDEVRACTILRSLVGSEVLGTGLDTGDRDEMGICIEPPTSMIGLDRFEHLVERTQPKGVRSGPGDLDVTTYSLRKFCGLALKGNPSVLILLFTPIEACTVWTLEAAKLRWLAPAFASRQAGKAFLRYAQRQRERLVGDRGQMNVKRPELVDRHGYDTKYASHVIRLGIQGNEYLARGCLTVPMADGDRDFILAIRRGEIPLKEVLSHAEVLEAQLEYQIRHSPLPERPNRDAVNEYLVAAYLDFWGAP